MRLLHRINFATAASDSVILFRIDKAAIISGFSIIFAAIS